MALKFSLYWFITEMCQVNNNIGTTRAVRRTAGFGSQQNSRSGESFSMRVFAKCMNGSVNVLNIILFFRSGTLPRWQFKDIGGIWKNYSKVRHNFLLFMSIDK